MHRRHMHVHTMHMHMHRAGRCRTYDTVHTMLCICAAPVHTVACMHWKVLHRSNTSIAPLPEKNYSGAIPQGSCGHPLRKKVPTGLDLSAAER